MRGRRKEKRKEIMTCFVVEYTSNVGKKVVDEIKNKIMGQYYKRRSKFTPPLIFKDLGVIGRAEVFGEPTEEYGVCIVSDVGSNKEWFENLVLEAIRDISKESPFDRGIHRGGVVGIHTVDVVKAFFE